MVSILPKLKYRFNAISKCQQLFCNTDKLIWKHTGSRMAEIILEEIQNPTDPFTLPKHILSKDPLTTFCRKAKSQTSRSLAIALGNNM